MERTRLLVAESAVLASKSKTIATPLKTLDLPTWDRIAAFGFGVLRGGFMALLPAFAADCFGRRSAGGVIGLLCTGRGVASLAWPPAVALWADLAGGHASPVAAAAALGALGTVLPTRARLAAASGPP